MTFLQQENHPPPKKIINKNKRKRKSTIVKSNGHIHSPRPKKKREVFFFPFAWTLLFHAFKHPIFHISVCNRGLLLLPRSFSNPSALGQLEPSSPRWMIHTRKYDNTSPCIFIHPSITVGCSTIVDMVGMGAIAAQWFEPKMPRHIPPT